MRASSNGRGFVDEEVEVAAFRGLGDGAAVKSLVAPRRRGRRLEVFEPPRDLLRLDQQGDPLVGDGQANAVAIAHRRDRAADRRLRRDVQHDRAERRAGHAPVRDADRAGWGGTSAIAARQYRPYSEATRMRRIAHFAPPLIPP